MILHDLNDHNALMPIGDLIEWVESDNSLEFRHSYFNDQGDIDSGWPETDLSIIREANKELRKPLELSDFVRPEHPQESDFVKEHTQEGYKAAAEDYKRARQEWKEWKPLFEGWEQIEDYKYEDGATPDSPVLKRGFQEIVIGLGTREDFLRFCKDHNIEL